MQCEAVWKIKVSTFGPFALLLSSSESFIMEENITVFRSTNLPDKQIAQFCRNIVDGANRTYAQFPAFTSTSRNRAKAEHFGGNVLFVMNVTKFDGYDVSPYSIFDEEEQLLNPNFIENKNQWEIHLQSA